MGIISVVFALIIMIPVVMFLTLCMANMVLADSLVAAVLGGIVLRFALSWHPVLCILGGILLFAGMSWLYLQEKAFWTLSAASSLIWAYLAGFLVHDLTGADLLWTAFAAAVCGIVIYGLHLHAGQGIRGTLR